MRNIEQQIADLVFGLRPIALTLTRNSHDTDDLLQDTVYRALIYKDRFAEGTNIKAWLYTIMRNIFINNYRKNNRRKTLQNDPEESLIVNNINLSVANEAERSFTRRSIKEAFDDIKDELKIPFEKHVEGFQYNEIAEEMKLPLGTVKSRIFFARKELQKKLARFDIQHA